MDDYIKREDAIEQARRNWTGEGDWIASTEINLLKNLPTADVVEVVRCKDCKWWGYLDDKGPVRVCHAAKHGYKSKNWDIGIYRTYNEDFYCADGERA